jgi:hypothetical protein
MSKNLENAVKNATVSAVNCATDYSTRNLNGKAAHLRQKHPRLSGA